MLTSFLSLSGTSDFAEILTQLMILCYVFCWMYGLKAQKPTPFYVGFTAMFAGAYSMTLYSLISSKSVFINGPNVMIFWTHLPWFVVAPLSIVAYFKPVLRLPTLSLFLTSAGHAMVMEQWFRTTVYFDINSWPDTHLSLAIQLVLALLFGLMMPVISLFMGEKKPEFFATA